MASVYVSSVIPAPLAAVWSVIRDFNGLPDWHPAVVESFIEQDQNAATVGCIRRFKQRSGAVIRERLDALDDRLHIQCYSIIQAPLPATDYQGRIQLARISEDDTTFATWEATFNCAATDKVALVADLSALFLEGFVALKTRCRR
jgi:hypothetical protein